MQPSGGGGGLSGGRVYYDHGRGHGEGKAAPAGDGGGEGGAQPDPAEPASRCWRKDPSDSGPPRGPGRRPVSATGLSSNAKIFLERDLSKERHELLKDQRLYRNQARKHSIETNKRRRALEEKWKETEEKEQQFREQILLQRKLKLQEATERFQRGHLPFSQRKRGGVQRKQEPKLDEALQKIQATGSHLSSLRVRERTTDMPLTTTRNDPFHWKQGSTKATGDGVVQENNKANLDRDQLQFQQNLDEMQHQLQEQHFSNLQDFHQEVNETANSESACSVDSLEVGEPNGSCTTPSETSSLSAHLDSDHKPQGSQIKNKGLPDETDIIFSKNQHVNNWLKNLNSSNIQTTSPFRDILIKYNVVSPDENTLSPGCTSSVPKAAEQIETERCASDNLPFEKNIKEEKSFLSKHPFSGTVSSESSSAMDAPGNKALTIPDPSPPITGQLVNSEQLQNNAHSSAQAVSHHGITSSSVDFHTRDWSATASYSNSFLLNCMQKGKEVHAARCTEDLDYVTNDKDEKYTDRVTLETSLFEATNEGNISKQEENREGKVKEIVLSVPHGDLGANSSHLDQERNGDPSEMKMPKSILKKESKYEHVCFKATVVNRGIRFSPMSVARDSIELAKIKGKDTDFQKNCKKLRWFDEINRVEGANDEEKCSEQSVTEVTEPQLQSPGFQMKATTSRTNLRSIPSCTLNSAFPENHENSEKSVEFSTMGVAKRNNVMPNAFLSTRYHVAKQAWMAPKGEEIINIQCNCDTKNPKNNSRKGKGKTVRRPKSAKAPSSPSVTKNRKGIIIRPQSANEASKVIKTQGKFIVPHPPWKPLLTKRSDDNPGDSIYQPANPCKPHTESENGRADLLEGHNLRDTAEDPSSSTCHSHTTAVQPSHSIVTYEPLTKTKSVGNTAQSITHCNSFPKRATASSGNGLCSNRTPTDEEITILWQGVHRALAQKDGAAGDSQLYAAICNNTNTGDLQLTRPNVAHITIDGGNLTGNVKQSVRMNAGFSSQPITSVALARRKQINENKRKALLEQRRQNAASARWRPNGFGQHMTQSVKQVQHQHAHEQAQATGGTSNCDKVSDSTQQFLLAENLVNLSATESEILTSLDRAQPHKQTVVLNRPTRQGMSALSLEEHKVLQSLDRINQKLHDVQENMYRNPSSTSVFQTIPPLVASPSYMDLISPMQRHKSATDATRTLKQRRH